MKIGSNCIFVAEYTFPSMQMGSAIKHIARDNTAPSNKRNDFFGSDTLEKLLGRTYFYYFMVLYIILKILKYVLIISK